VALNEIRSPAPPVGSGRLTTRRGRRASGVQWKLHQPQPVWEYPWIDATGPEKLVFMELVRRHIYFKFQVLLTELVPEARGLPVLNQSPYRADFAIPAYKIILDPWDDYHHALNARNDAVKLAVYQALGWTTYHVWSSELAQNGVSWWFNQIPVLAATKRGGFDLYHTQNDSAGIASMNAARRTFSSPTLKRRVSRGRRIA
jgi:hypothetical protein